MKTKTQILTGARLLASGGSREPRATHNPETQHSPCWLIVERDGEQEVWRTTSRCRGYVRTTDTPPAHVVAAAKGWRPTHRLTYRCNGGRSTVEVELDDEGVAYSAAEIACDSGSAEWEFDAVRGWTSFGEAGLVDSVEVLAERGE